MAKPSDREYKLFRKIRELEEQVNKLKTENELLKRKLEKTQDEPKYKKEKPKSPGGCPVCDATIKETELPFGKLRICSKGCGWRQVKHES